jgi:serine phosphatase RsbU (regulator of sigma subunit)
LAAVLQAQNHASPQQYITAMKTALDEFTDGFEASDDITMLAVTYNG